MYTVLLSKAEKSYITAGFNQTLPQRADGRGLTDYRSIALETGVAPLANGSARLCLGRNLNDNGGGTEILAATKLEVENISLDGSGEGQEGGRFVVHVSCSPGAYPHLLRTEIEDLQHDLTTVLHTTLTHPTLHPRNLTIVPRKRSWLLHLDLLILADAGNTLDALFLAARAALWDTKVPRTRSIEYKAPQSAAKGDKGFANETTQGGDMDMDEIIPSSFDTRADLKHATDFELPDYWDEGESLDGREKWPLCVTLNLAFPVHFLDATLQEEATIPFRFLFVFSFLHSPSSSTPILQGMRTLGAGEIVLSQAKELVEAGQKYVQELYTTLNAKLEDEDIRRTQVAQERFATSRR